MKRKFLKGLLVLVLAGEGYLAYDIINEDPNKNRDLSKINLDSLIIPSVDSGKIYVCSFNIQFLGNFKKRDNVALADILKNFDIVIIQELLAPPFDGVFPNGESFKPDKEAETFFKAMINQGFKYALSEEDTGPSSEIHQNSSSTEWWVGFYKELKVRVASDLPHGFLAVDRSNNPDFDRVPYAFPFRSLIDSSDFVLISVHLAPDAIEQQRRKHELDAIKSWINKNDSKEKDFIILGDMNIEDKEELSKDIPSGFISLNGKCLRTNTLINKTSDRGARPYDHIMYRPKYTSSEIDEKFNMVILNLIDLMKPYWISENQYPGDPYNHNLFKQYYSDHHPVFFRLKSNPDDD
jgi:endonuclease/exonuclease/phosphatase family metal-dependent hydrolase